MFDVDPPNKINFDSAIRKRLDRGYVTIASMVDRDMKKLNMEKWLADKTEKTAKQLEFVIMMEL